MRSERWPLALSMMLWFLFSLVISFLFPLRACGQTTLTLPEAVRRGLDPQVRASVALAESSRSQASLVVRQTAAALLPTAEFRASGGEQTRNLATFGLGGGGLGGGSTGPGLQLRPNFTSFDTRAAVTMTLLDLSARKTLAAARADVERTADDLAQEQEISAGQITRAYYDALRAGEKLSMLESNLALARDLEAAARNRLAAGTVTAVDVTRAQAQVASDESALETARFEAEKASLTLRRWLGLPLEGEVKLVRPGMPFEGAPAPALLAMAEGRRLDLASQLKREKVSSLKVSAAQRKFLPTISGSADYGPNGLTPADARNTRTLSLSLNIPVFDGGRRKAELSQAELALRDEQIRTRDLRQQIRLDIQVAQRGLTSARLKARLTDAEVELAEQQLTQSRARLAAGLGTALDVADAQTRLIRARDSRNLAQHQADLAQLDLVVATGSVRTFVDQQGY
ncbi:MAG: TolC family protein [Acidobacteria bacterium]|nr:TolC family protein [Acidobacteriota bacterium]